MRSKYYLLLLFLSFSFYNIAQVSIQSGNSITINFDNTVNGVNNGAFSGSGFATSPSGGQLDADAWAVSGLTDGTHSFGQQHTSGDFARGSSSGNVSSGGIYGFSIPNNGRALGFQPTGSDWTPGSVTLRVKNTGSSTIDGLTFSYNLFVRNDQGRSSSFKLAWSTNNSNFTDVSSTSYNSPSSANSSSWVSNSFSTTLSNISVAANQYIYFRWSSADVSGSGSRDELALDNIQITTTGGNGGGGGGGNPTLPYYDDIGSETCEELKTSLYYLINGHSKKSYSSLWYHFQSTDSRTNDAGNATIVWDMYTDDPFGPDANFTFGTNQCGSTSSSSACYNREHTFPKSWWGGSTSKHIYTDLFHVVPSDEDANYYRSNYAYGVVQPGTETVITNNGSKVGSPATYIPGYSELVFEPIDIYKGDVARNYFYVATRYENEIAGWENGNSRGDVVLDGTSYPVFEPWAIQLLFEWHNADPVSAKELARNDAIYAIQGNRNPFIDVPEYANLIWDCGGSGGGSGGDQTTVIHETYFETSLDGWIDGGGDCYRSSSSYAPEGNYSVRIRDNSGYASSMTSPSLDFSGMNSVEISFTFYAYGMETNENFFMYYYNGSSWSLIKDFVVNNDFPNNSLSSKVITLNSSNYNFPSNAKFRFQCDASSNGDAIYMDEIVITGTGSSAMVSQIKDTFLTEEAEMRSEMEEDKVEVSNNQIETYPNPATDLVYVKFPNQENNTYQVDIFNASSQLVQSAFLMDDGAVQKIDVSELRPGIYFMSFISENKRQVKKLIVR